MTVGERIKYIREDAGWTQSDLAEKLNLKDKASVCKVENGGDNITMKTLERYADALGVDSSVLMGWSKHEAFPRAQTIKRSEIEPYQQKVSPAFEKIYSTNECIAKIVECMPSLSTKQINHLMRYAMELTKGENNGSESKS